MQGKQNTRQIKNGYFPPPVAITLKKPDNIQHPQLKFDLLPTLINGQTKNACRIKKQGKTTIF